ncbi:MAG: DUF4339 domain-containing protein [Pirellulales bacterium]|nr:DUF4339 domain-containing protein [Pirellulales bacterium]
MALDWFYRAMEKQVGPVSSSELQSLAQAGTVTPKTPVANSPYGPWVPAEQVKGLFAMPNGSPQLAMATGTAQPPRATASEESSGMGTATKIALVVGGSVCILVLGFLLWFVAIRDTWELKNASRVSAKLDEAVRFQQSDPLTAYKIYDELLKEAKQHKIKDELFAQRLADAEKSRAALYPKVQEKIRAAQAEKQRLAQEEARQAAEEKQRVAEEENRKKAALEAQKIAEEKRRAEEKRLKEVVAAYSNSPQSARNALNAVKRVEARTEVGINFKDYSTVVGEAWAEVKIFTESPDGRKLPAFSFLLVSAMGKQKIALDVWQLSLMWKEAGLRGDEDLHSDMRQKYWGAAHRRIVMAESLITRDDVAIVLSRIAMLEKADAKYETEMKSLFSETDTVYSKAKTKLYEADIAKMSGRPEDQAKHQEEAKGLLQKRKELLQKIEDTDEQDKQRFSDP